MKVIKLRPVKHRMLFLCLFFIGLSSSFAQTCPSGVVAQTHTNVTCNGANDGTITVEVANGDLPLSFQLYRNTAPPGFVTFLVTTTTDPDGTGNERKVRFSNVRPGSYQVVVFGDASCTPFQISEGPTGTIVTQPNTLTSAVNDIDRDCNPVVGGANADGEINFTISGGTAPYNVTWPTAVTAISASTVNTNPGNVIASALDGGSYTVNVTDANGCFITRSFDVPISTAADAGPDQALCNVTSTTLSANTPGTGEVGTWTVVSGTGTFANSASPNTTVNGLTVGTTSVFRWTITDSGGDCPGNADDVSVQSISPSTPAVAGSDQSQCNSGSFTLAANAPTVGTGSWSIIGAANGATITTPSSNTSTVTGLSAGQSVTLRWTITSAGCSPSTDDIVLTNSTVPTPAAAGADQSQCNNSNFTLAANAPAVGTGQWSIVGAANGATITTPSSNTSTVTGLTAGQSVTLRWTITSLGCPPSTDDIVLTNTAPSSIAAAGADQSQCNSGNFTLAANAPSVGTGSWSIVGAANGAMITTPSSNTSTVTGLTAGQSVTLRWTITSPGCPPSTDDIVLTNNTAPTPAVAGTDQSQCNSGNFTLAANAPSSGTGSWSIVGAANGATITTPSSSTSTVTGLTAGQSVTLRWTITSTGCPPSTDDIILTNNAPASIAAAGPDQSQCNNSNFTLAANAPVVGTGSWSIVGAANGATITTLSSNTSTVTGLTVGQSVTLRWTITSPGCPPSTDDLVLTNNTAPTLAVAGPDQTQCNSGNFTLAANTPLTGTGSWSIIGAANGATITTPALSTSTVTGLTAGQSVTLRWTITSTGCPSSTDDIVLTNNAPASVAAAGPDQSQCNSGDFTLAATAPAVGTGQWSIVGAANGATITAPGSNTTTVTGLTMGQSVTLRWTVTSTGCPQSTDDIVLTNNAVPTVAAAGPDQSQCNSGNFTLAANAPVVGAGSWSIVGAANGATVTTPSSNTSTVTGLTAGQSVTLRWTISSAGCPSSTDDIVLTNSSPATTAVAGPDQAQCNNGNFILAANAPSSGTGSWSIVGAANGATIITPASNTSAVAGLIPGQSVTLRWTIGNTGCPSSTDDIVLTNNAPASIAAAGADQSQCNNGNFTLAANAPVTGTGSWSIVGAANGATITTLSSNTSTVTGLTAGQSVTLRWTITSVGCPPSTDDVVLTNNTVPTVAVAGPDQSQCNNGDFTLAANSASSGTGSWSIVGAANGATITTPSSNTSTVTGLTAGQSVTLRWTIAGTGCPSTTDDVVLTNNSPASIAAAGPDQSQCNDGNFTLAATAPVTGTGSWSIVGAANGATITTSTSNTSTVTGLTVGQSVTLRWTITNPGCPPSSDDIVLTNNTAPTVAVAGPDQTQCNSGDFTLAANAPSSGSGSWSIVGAANGAIITTPASSTSTVTGLTAGQSITLRWTISSTGCPSSTDDVILRNNSPATVAAAGTDQVQCNDGTFTLAANAPVVGTGSWSIVGSANGATITTPASNASGVTGLTAGQSVTLRWTITSAGCPSTTDDIVLTNNLPASIAVAGPDQAQCNNGDFTLAANAPVVGTGAWSIVGAANGATITTLSSNSSTVTGLAVGQSVTLRWTITSAGCSPSTDDVILTNNGAPSVAVAGPDQSQCNSGDFTLAANTPLSGSGLWTIVGAANGATITTPGSNASTVTGLTAGQSVTLRWTITGTGCPSTTDDVILTNNIAPSAAAAGVDQEQCNSGDFTLAANAPVVGTGLWSIVGAAGSAIITTPASNTSTVTGLTAGQSVTLRWTITSAGCPNSTDDIVLTNNTTPTVASAGLDQSACTSGDFTLAGNAPAVGTGSWSFVGLANGATITTPSSNTTDVTGLTAGQSVTLRWTITSAGCPSSTDDVVLTNHLAPTTADAGSDQIQCNDGNFTLAGNAPAVGTGLWVIVGAANGATIAAPSSNTSDVTGLTLGQSVTLRWTITSTGCPVSTDDVILTNTAAPTAASAGPDQSQCNNGSFTLAGNTPAVGTGLWSIVGLANGATITTPSSNVSTVTGLTAGQSVTLRWTISNASCTSFDDVILTNTEAPTATITGTTTICAGSSTNITVNFSGGTAPWSFVYSDGTVNSPIIPSFFNSISFPVTPTATTTYTLVSVTDNNGCVGTVTGNAIVTVNTQADASLAVGVTINPICQGGTSGITISNSETGVSYQLRNDANDASIGSPVSGNGGTITLSTGALSATTTFNILASLSGCTDVELTTKPTVNVSGSINASFSLTAVDNPICEGNGTVITLSNSEAGVNYQLRNDADNSNIGAVVAGTGTSIDLPTGNLTATTTFNILASNGTCSIELTDLETVDVEVSPLINLPVSVTIDPVCSGGSSDIQIDNSQMGVSYQLRNDTDDSFVGTTVAGTGGTILLPTGALTLTTTFNILASGGAACGSVELSTTATVNVNGTIDAGLTVVPVTTPICEGSSTFVRIQNSDATVNYQLRNDADNTLIGSALTGNGADLDIPTGALSASTTFNILASNGTCSIELASLATVSVEVNPDAALTVQVTIDPLCRGGTSGIRILNSENGVSYQLRNDADDSVVGTAVAGTGGTIILSTGALSATTTFNILATSGTACASVELSTLTTVNVTGTIDASLTTTASPATICSGGSTVVQVANSVAGINYQLRNNADDTNIGAVVAGNGSTIDLPTGNLTTTTTFNVLASNATCSIELTDTETVTVSPAPNNSLSVSATPALICSGNSTFIMITASEAGVTYQLRNNADNSLIGAAVSSTGGNLPIPTGNLSANTTINVLATLGSCSVQLTQTATISIRPAGDPACTPGTNCAAFTTLTVSSFTRPSCEDQNNGSITVRVVGGTGPYTISLTGNSFSQQVLVPGPEHTFSNLNPDAAYRYSVLDAANNFCELNFSLPLQTTVEASIDPTSVVHAECFGTPTGSVVINATGSETGEYYYSLDGSLWTLFTPGNVISGLPPNGSYNILVGEKIGDACRASVPVTINNANPDLNVTYTTTDASCNNNDGSITLNAPTAPLNGGGGPYEYALNNGITTTPFTDNLTFDGLAGGYYSVVVRDGKGCIKTFNSIGVTFPGFVEYNVIPSDASCVNNGLSGKLAVRFVTAGTFKVGISTDPLAEPTAYRTYTTFDPANDVALFFDSLNQGTYYVYAKVEGAACPTRKGSFTLGGAYALDFDIISNCSDNEVSIALTNMRGEPNNNFKIHVYKKFGPLIQTIEVERIPDNLSFVITHDGPANVFLRSPGEYQIQLEQNQVIGCTLTSPLIDYTVSEKLFAQVGSVSESYPDIINGKMALINFRNGTSPYEVRIELDSASVSGQAFGTPWEQVVRNANQQFDKNYENIPAGRYKVQVMDGAGCVLEFYARVPLDTDIYIPNIFTPNEDGFNDIFFVRNLPDNGASELVISDRWGKQVYSSKNYQNTWNGDGVSDGIYFYRLKVTSDKTISGWVEVLRGTNP